MNDKLAEFPNRRRDALIERVRALDLGEKGPPKAAYVRKSKQMIQYLQERYATNFTFIRIVTNTDGELSDEDALKLKMLMDAREAKGQ
jgi:hypothetical protein